ncbi:MAG: hypothetical protein HUK21_02755 [Fibrobacteraceae bacterium]|nr:hypothetical protein [Fibrobacteraceae bacterium]
MKKKKVWKTPAGSAVTRTKDEKIRILTREIISGQSRLLHQPDELYEALSYSIDDIEKMENTKVKLELLAWIMRCDFICSRMDDDDYDEYWGGIFYDAGTFFIELAREFEDKDYLSDLVHDMAIRHVGEEGRSLIFMSVDEFLPREKAQSLMEELVLAVSENDLVNAGDVLDGVCDMADCIQDMAMYTKAALIKDPDKSNATLIDIAYTYLMAGNLELCKQWVGDVRDPGAEDEESYLDLLAAIADKEGRKSDCLKIARQLYEKYPKVFNLGRLCGLLKEDEADSLLLEHEKYRCGNNADLDYMQLLASLKRYTILESYIDRFSEDLAALDPAGLAILADTLENDSQNSLAEKVKDWIVEEPEEAGFEND